MTDDFRQAELFLSAHEVFDVSGAGLELGVRVFLLLEEKASADIVKVEAVFDDQRDFLCEGIIVDGFALGDVSLKQRTQGARLIARRDRAKPDRAHNVPKIGNLVRDLGRSDRVPDRFDVSQSNIAQDAVSLTRNGIEEGADTGLLIVDPDVPRRQDLGILAATLEQVGQNPDQVARLLGFGCDEDLILQ
ncbi:hypothetical protein ACVWYH_003380 [Bradyrhizobium sp. GM24.11]